MTTEPRSPPPLTLDRALEDRLLSEREGDELVDLALHWGLSVETVHRLHEA